MAPAWNTTTNNTSPSAPITQTSAVTRPGGSTVRAKTAFGIVFALGDYSPAFQRTHQADPHVSVCFGVITGVFILKRRHDTRSDHTRPWLGMFSRKTFHKTESNRFHFRTIKVKAHFFNNAATNAVGLGGHSRKRRRQLLGTSIDFPTPSQQIVDFRPKTTTVLKE